jgi:hypothetical protein
MIGIPKEPSYELQRSAKIDQKLYRISVEREITLHDKEYGIIPGCRRHWLAYDRNLSVSINIDSSYRRYENKDGEAVGVTKNRFGTVSMESAYPSNELDSFTKQRC